MFNNVTIPTITVILRSKYYVELMLAITEYNYLKPAAGVSAERINHNPSLDYERNKKCTTQVLSAMLGGQQDMLL